MAYLFGDTYKLGEGAPSEFEQEFKLVALEIIGIYPNGGYYRSSSASRDNLKTTTIEGTANPSTNVGAYFQIEAAPTGYVSLYDLFENMIPMLVQWTKNTEYTNIGTTYYHYVNTNTSCPDILFSLSQTIGLGTSGALKNTTLRVGLIRSGDTFSGVSLYSTFKYYVDDDSGVVNTPSIRSELVLDNKINIYSTETATKPSSTYSSVYFLGIANLDLTYASGNGGWYYSKESTYVNNPYRIGLNNSTTIYSGYSANLTQIKGTGSSSGGGAGGSTSESEGGGGNFDTVSDNITSPNFTTNPLTGAAGTTIDIYNPTQTELANFNSFLWDTSVIKTIQETLTGGQTILDYVVKLAILPCDVPNTTPGYFSLGNAISNATGLSQTFTMHKAPGQFMTFDFGSVQLKEFWGNFLDYSPHTHIQIFLPFIGFRDLKTEDVMNKTISLKYNIDLISGSCIACIDVIENTGSGTLSQTLYMFAGNCETQIPLTGNFMQIDFGSLAALGLGASTSIVAEGSAAETFKKSVSESVTEVSGNTFIKPKVQRSGSISGNSGFCGALYPYIVINRPEQVLPVGYEKQNGYPCNITYKLSDLTGYTEVRDIHLTGYTCSKEELDELKMLLQKGIII